jgi:hypothetical protein
MAQTLDTEEAARLAQQALAELPGFDAHEEHSKPTLLAQISSVMLQLGDERARAQVQRLAMELTDAKLRAEALSGVAQAELRARHIDRAMALATDAIAAIQAVGGTWQAPVILARISAVLSGAGRSQEATRYLQLALTAARVEGRDSVFSVLGEIAAGLSADDNGQTLWRVFEAVEEVESWWDS